MKVVSENIKIETKGNADVIDITAQVQKKLEEASINNGIVNITAFGSTGALTTIEYEPGLKQDTKDIFDKLIPQGRYCHDDTWGDGNGHAHLRASMVGPNVTISFSNGELILGTWQQIVFIDFDNRARSRRIVLQFLGE